MIFFYLLAAVGVCDAFRGGIEVQVGRDFGRYGAITVGAKPGRDVLFYLDFSNSSFDFSGNVSATVPVGVFEYSGTANGTRDYLYFPGQTRMILVDFYEDVSSVLFVSNLGMPWCYYTEDGGKRLLLGEACPAFVVRDGERDCLSSQECVDAADSGYFAAEQDGERIVLISQRSDQSTSLGIVVILLVFLMVWLTWTRGVYSVTRMGSGDGYFGQMSRIERALGVSFDAEMFSEVQRNRAVWEAPSDHSVLIGDVLLLSSE